MGCNTDQASIGFMIYSSDFLRRPPKFNKLFAVPYLEGSKKSWEIFFKFLRPSLNIWTLIACSLYIVRIFHYCEMMNKKVHEKLRISNKFKLLVIFAVIQTKPNKIFHFFTFNHFNLESLQQFWSTSWTKFSVKEKTRSKVLRS